MALEDFYSNFHLLFRWLHIISGITWVGLLYFFNFVNIPLQGALDDNGKKIVNPQLMPRALFWFRWGAMFTFLAGWVLFTIKYMYTPGAGFGPTSLFSDENGITGRAAWILMGMAFGTMMWFNVWFVIWPAQKKILRKTVAGDELTRVRTLAAKASRANTFMSGPMLFGMIGAPNYGAANWVTLLVAISIGMLAAKGAYMLSTKVSTNV
ncbi:MAG: hypothetical protein A2Z83_02715 [Omnitrophica bacterium GWA2_52_8]|nr:MAG: hypothetical protein A2Z83_02715 [Omnitrophica bacterium GWA2_52_8]